jgi:hypothetical protein
MTEQEFKEILETIEKGLYKKWLLNFKAYQSGSVFRFLEKHEVGQLIVNSFIWSDTIEGYTYWHDIQEDYIQILNYKKLI